MNPLILPAGLVGVGAATSSAPKLPAAPPRAVGLWDAGNRHKTLLAIGTGLLSGGNFGEGMARAGQNVLGLEEALRASSRATREFGGPDDAFEIITDPQNGERTVREVPQFSAYLQDKRTKAKDVADINGRAMFAIEQLPQEERAAAYRAMRSNPDRFGIDPATMPEEYDPNYGRIASSMGMTVSQAQTRQQAERNAADARANREAIHEDRRERTGIYRERAAATTAQGAARLAQGAQRIAISKTNAAKKGGGKTPKLNPKNLDLGYLIN